MPEAYIVDAVRSPTGRRFSNQFRGYGDDHFGPAPAGSFAPNPFGLHDVIGNVWEICRDRFSSYEEYEPRPGDGLRDDPTTIHRVTRGGCYMNAAENHRSGNRRYSQQSQRSSAVGFRAAERAIGFGQRVIRRASFLAGIRDGQDIDYEGVTGPGSYSEGGVNTIRAAYTPFLDDGSAGEAELLDPDALHLGAAQLDTTAVHNMFLPGLVYTMRMPSVDPPMSSDQACRARSGCYR